MIHEGIDSTLMILHNRLKGTQNRPTIEVIKEYGDLPLVECYAGQLNQVFMNLVTQLPDDRGTTYEGNIGVLLRTREGNGVFGENSDYSPPVDDAEDFWNQPEC